MTTNHPEPEKEIEELPKPKVIVNEATGTTITDISI